MTSYKARKEGNSIVITLPSSLGVKECEEFFITKKENGAIIIIPKVEEHFSNVTEGEYDMPEEDVGLVLTDRELEVIRKREADDSGFTDIDTIDWNSL